MNKICTSQEQSKKLVDLEIDINTADMIYNIFDESYIRHDTPIDKYHTPAWSLTALLGLMPIECKLEKTLFDQSDYFTYACEWTGEYRTFEHEDPIDAAFEMVCWLKENNYYEI